MEQILLEDEEIWSILGVALEERHLRCCRGEFDSFKDGAKAQLKKVAVWIDDEYKYLTMSAEAYGLLSKIRQALLEEIK